MLQRWRHGPGSEFWPRKNGSSSCTVPAGGALLSASASSQGASVQKSSAAVTSWPRSISSGVYIAAESEVRRTIPRGLKGRGPVHTRSHAGRKTPRLIIITFYEHLTQSVSHSDAALGLSPRHENALCRLSLVRLVAATHAVIRRKRGDGTGQSQLLTCPVGQMGAA